MNYNIDQRELKLVIYDYSCSLRDYQRANQRIYKTPASDLLLAKSKASLSMLEPFLAYMIPLLPSEEQKKMLNLSPELEDFVRNRIANQIKENQVKKFVPLPVSYYLLSNPERKAFDVLLKFKNKYPFLAGQQYPGFQLNISFTNKYL